MNIMIHIERLVLDGIDLPHADRPLLQSAIETELARLISGGGVGESLRAGGAMPSVPAAPISVAPGGTPAQMGEQIAQSVYGGLNG